MSQDHAPAGPEAAGGGDPWGIPARLLSGMLLGAVPGWLLDRWLGTGYLVLLGLLAGTALAVYVIYVRLNSS